MQPSRTAIIDIETAGLSPDQIDGEVRRYFTRDAITEDDIKKAEDAFSLHPSTAHIVAIGIMEPDSLTGRMYFQAQGSQQLKIPMEDGGVTYVACTEAELLTKFWSEAQRYTTLVTYNGRGFDFPFIIMRSAMLGIKPTRDLMPSRYSDSHIDLMDRISFYGSFRRNVSLDVWCRSFGLKSPKEQVAGYMVSEMFRQGKFMEIARYCAEDIRATCTLYNKLKGYVV